MASPQGTQQLNADAFLALPESEHRLELVTGEMVVTPMPSSDHQEVSQYVSYLLRERVGTRGRLLIEKEMVVDRTEGAPTIRVPDVLYIRESRRALVTPQAVDGPADIVVEVLSESTELTDRVTKRREYRACGVPEYWLVDMATRTVIVHDFRHGSESRHGGDQTWESPILRELGLPSTFRTSDFFIVLD